VCRNVFPSSKCLFMYRDVAAVAKSVYRFTMVLPFVLLARLCDSVTAPMKKKLAKGNRADRSDFCILTSSSCVLDNALAGGVLMSAVVSSTYLDFRRRGFDVSALRYEDLVERPLDMCRILMEFCGLPVSLAELAVKGLDVDSQRNSIFAKSSLAHIEVPQLTPETKEQLNELLKKYGVPLIGEPNILEGTLSCS